MESAKLDLPWTAAGESVYDHLGFAIQHLISMMTINAEK